MGDDDESHNNASQVTVNINFEVNGAEDLEETIEAFERFRHRCDQALESLHQLKNNLRDLPEGVKEDLEDTLNPE